jgi:quercetin dioxygenase-like cupin family protein
VQIIAALEQGRCMKGIGFSLVRDAEEADGYRAPHCLVRGGVRSSMVSFDGFPLWLVRAELADGAVLEWEGAHGDEALYVVSGELDVSGRRCPSSGVVVVESGARATVEVPGGARLLHFGPQETAPPSGGHYGAPSGSPHGVHVIGPGGMFAAAGPGRETRMFADSTCETCRITLFVTARDSEYVSSRHSHSVDEVLYLVRGRIRFGSRELRPGDAVCIEAHRRYAFRSGPEGFAFLNYRRDASEQTIVGDIPRPEGGKARGLTPVFDER